MACEAAGASPRARNCSVVTHPYGIQMLTSACSEAEACGSSPVFLSWINSKAFKPTFSPSCCFSGVCAPDSCLSSHSYCVILLQPLCCLPLFCHVGLMCVMYICMVLWSSFPQNLTCIPISPGILPNIFFGVPHHSASLKPCTMPVVKVPSHSPDITNGHPVFTSP